MSLRGAPREARGDACPEPFGFAQDRRSVRVAISGVMRLLRPLTGARNDSPTAGASAGYQSRSPPGCQARSQSDFEETLADGADLLDRDVAQALRHTQVGFVFGRADKIAQVGRHLEEGLEGLLRRLPFPDRTACVLQATQVAGGG